MRDFGVTVFDAQHVPAGKYDQEFWFADVRLWLRRPTWWKTPKFMIRAAPTCTLWEVDFAGDFLRFRFCKSWKISAIQIMEAQ